MTGKKISSFNIIDTVNGNEYLPTDQQNDKKVSIDQIAKYTQTLLEGNGWGVFNYPKYVVSLPAVIATTVKDAMVIALSSTTAGEDAKVSTLELAKYVITKIPTLPSLAQMINSSNSVSDNYLPLTAFATTQGHLTMLRFMSYISANYNLAGKLSELTVLNNAVSDDVRFTTPGGTYTAKMLKSYITKDPVQQVITAKDVVTAINTVSKTTDAITGEETFLIDSPNAKRLTINQLINYTKQQVGTLPPSTSPGTTTPPAPLPPTETTTIIQSPITTLDLTKLEDRSTDIGYIQYQGELSKWSTDGMFLSRDNKAWIANSNLAFKDDFELEVMFNLLKVPPAGSVKVWYSLIGAPVTNRHVDNYAIAVGVEKRKDYGQVMTLDVISYDSSGNLSVLATGFVLLKLNTDYKACLTVCGNKLAMYLDNRKITPTVTIDDNNLDFTGKFDIDLDLNVDIADTVTQLGDVSGKVDFKLLLKSIQLAKGTRTLLVTPKTPDPVKKVYSPLTVMNKWNIYTTHDKPLELRADTDEQYDGWYPEYIYCSCELVNVTAFEFTFSKLTSFSITDGKVNSDGYDDGFTISFNYYDFSLSVYDYDGGRDLINSPITINEQDVIRIDFRDYTIQNVTTSQTESFASYQGFDTHPNKIPPFLQVFFRSDYSYENNGRRVMALTDLVGGTEYIEYFDKPETNETEYGLTKYLEGYLPVNTYQVTEGIEYVTDRGTRTGNLIEISHNGYIIFNAALSDVSEWYITPDFNLNRMGLVSEQVANRGSDNTHRNEFRLSMNGRELVMIYNGNQIWSTWLGIEDKILLNLSPFTITNVTKRVVLLSEISLAGMIGGSYDFRGCKIIWFGNVGSTLSLVNSKDLDYTQSVKFDGQLGDIQFVSWNLKQTGTDEYNFNAVPKNKLGWRELSAGVIFNNPKNKLAIKIPAAESATLITYSLSDRLSDLVSSTHTSTTFYGLEIRHNQIETRFTSQSISYPVIAGKEIVIDYIVGNIYYVDNGEVITTIPRIVNSQYVLLNYQSPISVPLEKIASFGIRSLFPDESIIDYSVHNAGMSYNVDYEHLVLTPVPFEHNNRYAVCQLQNGLIYQLQFPSNINEYKLVFTYSTVSEEMDYNTRNRGTKAVFNKYDWSNTVRLVPENKDWQVQLPEVEFNPNLPLIIDMKNNVCIQGDISYPIHPNSDNRPISVLFITYELDVEKIIMPFSCLDLVANVPDDATPEVPVDAGGGGTSGYVDDVDGPIVDRNYYSANTNYSEGDYYTNLAPQPVGDDWSVGYSIFTLGRGDIYTINLEMLKPDVFFCLMQCESDEVTTYKSTYGHDPAMLQFEMLPGGNNLRATMITGDGSPNVEVTLGYYQDIIINFTNLTYTQDGGSSNKLPIDRAKGPISCALIDRTGEGYSFNIPINHYIDYSSQV